MYGQETVMGLYRKFLDAEYGGVSEEVRIGEPQRMDTERPDEWRGRVNAGTIKKIRAEMAELSCYGDLMRVRTEERTVRREGADIPLRIYFPDSGDKIPVMLFCHGGAFSMNNIDVYDMVQRYFACYGKMIVAAADYRLAPEYPFPCGLEDCYAALEWLGGHAGEIGGNPDNINVCGDSSGGNYAAVLCLMAKERSGPAVKKQALIYPVTILAGHEPLESEIRYKEGYFLEYQDIKDLHKGYVPEGTPLTLPYLSPLCAENLEGLPPAGFFSAECDPLLDQGLMYAAKLADAGVKTEYHIYKGMIHAFLNAAYGKTFEMMDEVGRFLNTDNNF